MNLKALNKDKADDLVWALNRLFIRNKLNPFLMKFESSDKTADVVFEYDGKRVLFLYNKAYDLFENKKYDTKTARTMDRRYQLIHFIEQQMGWTPEIA